MSSLVDKARQFAIQSHQRIDQRRKYTGQPYEMHLKSVAELVTEVSDDEETISAAWLHDTVEDTPVTLGDIERGFGAGVAQLVGELTDVSKPGDGNRAQRKTLDREHIARASPRAKTVKLADLIDNCRDICRNDARFARVFLPETVALLHVLDEGDRTLYQRALRVVRGGAEQLGVAIVLPGEGPEYDDPPEVITQHYEKHQRALNLFTRVFRAQDLARPLPFFDASQSGIEVADALARQTLAVAGVLRAGVVVAHVRPEDLDERHCGANARSFAADQVLADDASLADVIAVLTRHDHCFVAHLERVVAYVGRDEMQSPVVRMWLFGIITLYEMVIGEHIDRRWPDGSWRQALSASRLQRAQALQEERRRRGQHSELLECLQLSDKARVLLDDPEELQSFGFKTRGAAKRAFKDFESLRNNLAHAQDIVTHDWAQIARMSRRLEELAAAPR